MLPHEVPKGNLISYGRIISGTFPFFATNGARASCPLLSLTGECPPNFFLHKT